MVSAVKKYRLKITLAALLAGAGFLMNTPSRAQDEPEASASDSSGYRVGEDTSPIDNSGGDGSLGADKSVSAEQGPVRLARFSVVKGNVTWRGDDSAEWSKAATNLPLRQGAQIWVTEGGRAEIQFDDGSVLRLGNNALVTLQTLYSDAEGEFTEIKQNDGLATLKLTQSPSVYQVDTPYVSVKASGPARIRLGATNGMDVAVQSGKAAVEGPQGKITLQSGDYLALDNPDSAYNVRRLPGEDSWDRWNDDRDRELSGGTETRRRLPSNIAIAAQNLDDYGTWRDDPEYGAVWCPRVTASDWRPYYYGHWVWVNPFGWTWVSDEPWGWAPYHYGTWVRARYGWGWCPGPSHQYWSPAVVNFSVYNGNVGWCALGPREIRYPSTLSIGFRSGNWSLFFSIGQCGVYYPSRFNYCEARPFRNGYVNRITNVRNTTIINNYGNTYVTNRNTFVNNSTFVPRNARNGGVIMSPTGSFGGAGRYQPGPQNGADIFTRGRTIGMPMPGHSPVAGPQTVQPTLAGTTPGRTFEQNLRPRRTVMNREVYQSPVRPTIARESAPILPTGAPAPRSNGNIVPLTNNRGYGRNLPTTQGSVGRTPGSPANTDRFGGYGRTGTDRNRSIESPEAPTRPWQRDTTTGRTDRAPRIDPTPTDRGGSNNSAAEEARRARGSLGLPTTGGRDRAPAEPGTGGSRYGGTRSDGGGYTRRAPADTPAPRGSDRTYSPPTRSDSDSARTAPRPSEPSAPVYRSRETGGSGDSPRRADPRPDRNTDTGRGSDSGRGGDRSPSRTDSGDRSPDRSGDRGGGGDSGRGGGGGRRR